MVTPTAGPTRVAQAREAIRPEVAAFIARRTKPASGFRRSSPIGLGHPPKRVQATYQGRRQIADGIEAVLLDRGGETLVMVVTPAQAARAPAWRVADIVRADDRGRLHDHRAADQGLDEDREQDDRGR